LQELNQVFVFRTFRFEFKAQGPVFFPRGMAGNIFRGAFGQIFRRVCDELADGAYARIFEPQHASGPSGFANVPRPFVLRPQGLDQRSFRAGDLFYLDVHLFDLDERLLTYFVQTFLHLAQEGLGPGRVPVELTAVQSLTLERRLGGTVWNQAAGYGLLPPPLQIDLHPVCEAAERLRVEFRTPTELKSESSISEVPEFAILFRRVRDRISALSSFYGQSLEFDFKSMGKRSQAVRLTGYQTQWERAERRSSRTGQQHSLNGFVGWAEYEGDLREFTPWLQTGYWSGVGRQTVWGKGEIIIKAINDP
jgi:CRISPR-associated endoribonuclease Cas6